MVVLARGEKNSNELPPEGAVTAILENETLSHRALRSSTNGFASNKDGLRI
jgi:hypothetical protein